jgi:hypothetical protein
MVVNTRRKIIKGGNKTMVGQKKASNLSKLRNSTVKGFVVVAKTRTNKWRILGGHPNSKYAFAHRKRLAMKYPGRKFAVMHRSRYLAMTRGGRMAGFRALTA